MALRNASDFLGAYGGGVRVERRQCAEHGGYAAKSVLRGVWTGCPACRKLEAADEMAAYAETLRRGAMRDALEKRIGRSGIAPRFRNCRIENYAVSDSIPGMARAKAKKTGRHETELSLLADYGITGQVAADFLQVRKAKRQPLTETAMRLIAADAEKCGMTALQAAEYAIASGWGSFRADWLQNKTFGRSGNRGGPTHNQTAAVPDAGSYGDMPTTDF
ncbi:putative phage associated protein [Neisseria gonorrhoeae]|uniref:hypothetical protein n=1 Tax=Neisseria gonorrhoeae TaxID=485 RepID=UPI0005E768F8|nr:hypothetical protein [Neisseria gonorrhoeae]CNR96751.1 putative phage associated protein [Neisseria gonorrhoeae]